MKTSQKGFSRHPYFTLIACLIALYSVLGSGCETIDPQEQIPAFLKIDSVKFNVASDEGGNASEIEDLWVYADEKFLGVFPIPVEIPILNSGPTDVRIEAGIRVNGLAGARSPNPFYTSFQQNFNLMEDSSINLVPSFGYSGFTDFAWIEDFEDAGITLVSTSSSYTDVERTTTISGEGFQGQSALFRLQESQLVFECVNDVFFDLPGAGNTTILEFQYRGNNSLVVGTIVRNPGATIQESFIVLNPQEDWNRIYLNLTGIVSGNPNNTGVKIFFGFTKDESVEGDSKVYIDNIKLVH